MCKLLDLLAVVLVIIAALNYGIGVFNVDVLSIIFGKIHWLNMLVQIVIGLSGVYMVFRCPRMCNGGSCPTKNNHSEQANHSDDTTTP
ncbi:DUF378 domain-containing protein [Thiotrichales bacterium 19S3-7]|nr:DUF378 domain-containing protein [Thiotrichales bacterium 19S3-7]MCF6801552.1 DUF378 domain-containing protein [Thiotrichales bacterium 19S3-11]